MEAPYEIWLWLAKRFLRRRSLKSVDDDDGRRQMDNGACLYYKLTYEPKSSGELKRYTYQVIHSMSNRVDMVNDSFVGYFTFT